MSNFKVGDKVRCLDTLSACGLYLGRVYEVQDISILEREIKVDERWHMWSRFELVEPTKDELQELVDKANEGLRARQLIQDKYQAQVQVRTTLQNDFIALNEHYTLEYRIKPTPKFEPFAIGEDWIVSLDGDSLWVGCKKFPIATAKHQLDALLNQNVNQTASCTASRQGINHLGHFITWLDAEFIYNAIKDIK